MSMFDLKKFFAQQKSISMLNEDTYELNIQPAASILNVFSRLSYKAWYAIAEFVDNATQSYFSHREELSNTPFFDKLTVEITYDSEKNTLIIKDNAYGMEIDKFKDAILLDSRNEQQTGRNEFGMGLKTAASWFGNIWSVKSTQLGSINEFYAEVNIPKLKLEGLNSINIHRKTVDADSHGTTIEISDITKKVTGSRTVGKIRALLSSMYRRDINNENIEIIFNGIPISFSNYPILSNFRGKLWKKTLDFTVLFEGKDYRVTGFVAIMNPGSFPKAGFALFRQDRVIVGGIDSNYKPSEIFGQMQSQRSLKLFGELNMDDFPVNQAKDGFIWDDGLENAFIEALKNNIQEYIQIAELSKKQRLSEEQYSIEKSNHLHEQVLKAIENLGESGIDDSESVDEFDQGINQESYSSDMEEYIGTVLNGQKQQEEMVGTVREYSIPFNQVTKRDFKVQWTVGSKVDYWIEYSEDTGDTINVIINIDHPFFKPYVGEEDFKIVLEKFVLSYIMAEQQAKMASDNKEGLIYPSAMKSFMNQYLSKMAED